MYIHNNKEHAFMHPMRYPSGAKTWMLANDVKMLRRNFIIKTKIFTAQVHLVGFLSDYWLTKCFCNLIHLGRYGLDFEQIKLFFFFFLPKVIIFIQICVHFNLWDFKRIFIIHLDRFVNPRCLSAFLTAFLIRIVINFLNIKNYTTILTTSWIGFKHLIPPSFSHHKSDVKAVKMLQ